jgi:hypothetical protein
MVVWNKIGRVQNLCQGRCGRQEVLKVLRDDFILDKFEHGMSRVTFLSRSPPCPLRTQLPKQLRIPEPWTQTAARCGLETGVTGSSVQHSIGRCTRQVGMLGAVQRIVPCRPCEPASAASDRLACTAVYGWGLGIVDAIPSLCPPCVKLLHGPSLICKSQESRCGCSRCRIWLLPTLQWHPSLVVANNTREFSLAGP